MTKEDKIRVEKAALLEKLGEVDKRLGAAKGERFAKCEKCKKRTKIKRLIFIQTHWYTPPHGCTEGDYWNYGEGQWPCPFCCHINRMCDFNKQEWLMEYKRQFALVVNKHDHYGESKVLDKDQVEIFKRKWRELYGKEITL